METEEELLVFIWSSGPLEFFDASPSLQPFTYYQYRLHAHNSKGSVLSQRTLARTLSARPRDMPLPTATPTGELYEMWILFSDLRVLLFARDEPACRAQVHTLSI